MNPQTQSSPVTKAVRVAVFGTAPGGGTGVEIVPLTVTAAQYEAGDHYELASSASLERGTFENVLATMDENDPGASSVVGLKSNNVLSYNIQHWTIRSNALEKDTNRPEYELSIKDHGLSDHQVYVDIQRINDPTENPDMMSVIAEIGTDPVTRRDAPVLHVSGSSDDKLISIYQVGSKLHLRLCDSDVRLSHVVVKDGMVSETIRVVDFN